MCRYMKLQRKAGALLASWFAHGQAKIALKVAIIDQDFKQFKKNRDLFKRLDEKGQGNLMGPDAELLLKKLGEDAQGNAILEALKDADTN